MKRITLALIIVLLAVAAGSLTAQMNIENRSDLYPKTFYIYRIYPHSLGYRVDYMLADGSIGVLYAPTEWFRQAGSYGEVVYGMEKSFPYITFFYEGDRISHFRLYVFESYNHPSWGVLDQNTDYTENFNVTEPVVLY